MARTPLFSLIRRTMRIAAKASRPGAPPVDDVLGRLQEKDFQTSRRTFLKISAAAGAAAAVPDLFSAFAADSTSRPRVAVVGAGVAGLNCAYKLRKANVPVTVFEAAGRTGGRMLTAKDIMAPGLTTEMGGEFIDSGHEEMLALAREFKLGLWDFQELTGVKDEAFFFNGAHRSEAQVVKEFIPLAKKIAADAENLGEEINYREHGGGQKLDRMSIAEYLDVIGARGWIRDLLEVAYVTEYGLEADEQSALNLILLIGTDTEEGFEAFGESDERFTVKGGNQRITDELAKRLEGAIEMRHRLVAVTSKGSGYALTFDANGKSIERTFDSVVLTLPFTMLREVDLRLPLPDVKRRAIKELGYGNNAKVMAGFRSRKWRALGYGGNTLTDEPFQLCWDNAGLQPSTASGITFYSGGSRALDAGRGTAKEALDRYLPGFEKAYPGSTALLNGKVSRFHWPTNPFVKAAYACYRPGQWTTIAGAEGESVGSLHFAGEHTSLDFQGYMNGGAQSGADAAAAVVASVSRKAAELFPRIPRRRVV
jgi:monoamine oxidase